MGNQEKNPGTRRRRHAARVHNMHPTAESWIMTLPSGKNDLGKPPGRISGARSERILPSKFARAHTVKVGRVFETYDGQAYQWQANGSALKIAKE
jgi:hypothetical protein